MRKDSLSTLRQRLKRGSFEFGALLEGVSTLEEDAPHSKEERLAEPAEAQSNVVQTVAEARALAGAVAIAERPAALPEPPGPLAARMTPAAADQPLLPLPEAPLATPVSRLSEPERLRSALDSLGCRFLQQVDALRSALAQRDVEDGGFHLAHLNQVLELLRDVDPDGETARHFATIAAPPIGRGWPAPCWSVVEFAASPFSGLLPSRADDGFVRDLVYSAWGVTFEAAV